MSNPVMVNKRSVSIDGSVALHHYFWCPGCDDLHAIYSKLPETLSTFPFALWDWDGRDTSPTFSPSIKVMYGMGDAPSRDCHSYLRDGIWEFLGDSWHDLKNKKVPMVPVPDWVAAKERRLGR